MAKIFIFIGFVSIALNSYASDLQTGDVLLQPLNCWACNLIEQQEDSIYAHMGVYLKIDGDDYIVEAFGKVRLIPLSEFLKKTKGKSRVKVIRAKSLNHQQRNELLVKSLSLIGSAYDAMFLWDNYIDNTQAFYCSELVYKIFVEIYKFKYLRPKEMLFDINPEYWDIYFKGETPRNHTGISPEDFHLSLDFKFVKFL